jgi:hypothetical protein
MTPFSFTVRRHGSTEAQTFTAGEHFRFDVERIEVYFSNHLPSPLIDLLRIAVAVYVADRTIRRRQRNQVRQWSRKITLTVGVLEPMFWETDEIRDSLVDCLEFLTDDSWDISFEQDDRRQRRDIQRNLFPPRPDSRLCLYSAGLDSAAGLGTQLLRFPERPTIPVTVWHQGGQKHNVERQIGLLRKHFNTELTPLIFKTHLLWGSRERWREEPTQRSRAFLFMSAGAAAAYMSGGSEVEVYESGVGAINLPLLSGMTGSRTTRSTHPEFLRRMSGLVSTVANKNISFTLPCWENTKGQMVRNLADAGLHKLAKCTVSCVSYPLRDKKSKQCGICPACIFRRQAMLSAGIHEDCSTYKYDIFAGSEQPRPLKDGRLAYLKAFLMQVAELEEVQSGRRLPERVLRHLMGTGILRNGESSAPFIRLLSEYRREWLEVTQQAEQRGYSWTKLLAASGNTPEGASRASA